MNDSQSINRSTGDKLLILGAHYNAHPELPESINIDSDSDGNLSVQLDNGAITGVLAWTATMADVTWRADDFRDTKWSRPLWHVFALGIIASMPVVVWLGIPGDYADTAEAVIAKLTESAVAGVR